MDTLHKLAKAIHAAEHAGLSSQTVKVRWDLMQGTTKVEKYLRMARAAIEALKNVL